jgi:putative methyltransferase (TIGR04325 family)
MQKGPEVIYFAALALGKPDPHIVDFGGNTGDHATLLLQRLPQARYTVVENPTMVRLANGRFGSISFTSTIPASCDIFFTSCTLPYLSDPYAVIAAGCESAASACIFVRNCFTAEEKIRVQRTTLFANGGGEVPKGYDNLPVSYPHRTIVEAELRNFVERAGFELAARLPEPVTAWPTTSDIQSAQLVFLRR